MEGWSEDGGQQTINNRTIDDEHVAVQAIDGRRPRGGSIDDDGRSRRTTGKSRRTTNQVDNDGTVDEQRMKHGRQTTDQEPKTNSVFNSYNIPEPHVETKTAETKSKHTAVLSTLSRQPPNTSLPASRQRTKTASTCFYSSGHVFGLCYMTLMGGGVGWGYLTFDASSRFGVAPGGGEGPRPNLFRISGPFQIWYNLQGGEGRRCRDQSDGKFHQRCRSGIISQEGGVGRTKVGGNFVIDANPV